MTRPFGAQPLPQRPTCAATGLLWRSQACWHTWEAEGPPHRRPQPRLQNLCVTMLG